MRTREEQIAELQESLVLALDYNSTSEADWIIQEILEAERRAEARVRAEVARDSERLDWLEKVAPDITMVGDGWGNRDYWHIVWANYSKGTPSDSTGENLREAIDTAMEVE